MRYVYLISVMAALGGCCSKPSPEAQEIIRMIEDEDLDWEVSTNAGIDVIRLGKVEVTLRYQEMRGGSVLVNGSRVAALLNDADDILDAAKRRYTKIAMNQIKKAEATALGEKLKRLKKEQVQWIAEQEAKGK